MSLQGLRPGEGGFIGNAQMIWRMHFFVLAEKDLGLESFRTLPTGHFSAVPDMPPSLFIIVEIVATSAT